ncbi:hypothetical protein [Rhodococcus sp. NPDC003348]
MTDTDRLPAVFDAFFDDAAVFPPGRAPLDRAVREHLARRDTALGASVGPLLLTPDHLDEAARLAEVADEPLRVGVVVAPAGLDDAMGAIERAGRAIAVTGLELKTSDKDIERTVTAAAALTDRFGVHVELSMDRIRSGAVSLLAGGPVRLKARTGGLVPEAFPTADDLASMIEAAVGTGTSFKLTAGLHRAVRYTDEYTGFAHHGFLNIAVATAAALAGADHATLSEILEERDGVTLAGRFDVSDTAWRARFESFGTCSIAEPIETLAELGLAPAPTARATPILKEHP